MNGKELLEGLTGIDDGYIQEAQDPQPVRLPWLRWSAVAACLCLVLALLPQLPRSSDNQAEDSHSAAETAAHVDPESYTFGCKYIRVGHMDPMVYPEARVIRSRTELDALQIDEAVIYTAMTYTEEFFEKYDLLVIQKEENSGSIRHECNGLRPLANGMWEMRIRRIVPEACTMDMAMWFILVEVEKDRIPDGENVTVTWLE